MEELRKNERFELPFKIEDLKDSDISKQHLGSGKFFEVDNLPNKVVRSERRDDLLNKHNNRIEIADLIETARKLFKELEEKCGIIVPADFYIGIDREENEVVYSVVDRIEGHHLEDEEIDQEFESKVMSLYGSIASYFLDKLGSGGLYLWDINNQSQYIYGNKIGESEKNIYLVDTDLWLGNTRAGLCLSVYWLTRHMSSLERKIGKRFKDARNNIKQFTDLYPIQQISDDEKKQIQAIKEFLSHTSSEYDTENAIPKFE